MTAETATAFILFNLFLPIWQQRPFEPADLVPGPYPVFVAPAAIEFCAGGFAHGDEEQRLRIAQALGKTESATAAAALAARLPDETGRAVRAALVYSLANLPVDGLDGPALAAHLRAVAPEMRLAALRLAVRFPEPPEPAVLELALSDATREVRLAAAEALARLPGLADLGRLAPLRGDPDPAVRASAWRASLMRGDPARLPALADEAVTDEDVAVRFAVAAAAAADPGLAGRIGLRLAGDPHASVRTAAASALARGGGEAAVTALLTLARDPDAEVRRLAVAALAGHPGARALQATVEGFADPRPFVRETAEETAVALAAAIPVGPAVAAVCTGNNPDARFRAYNTLGRLELAEFADAVVSGLGREVDPVNLAAAIRSLRRMKVPGHEALILGYAGHASPRVRAEVASALGNFGSDGSLSQLDRMVDDEDRLVRLGAVTAIGVTGNARFSATLVRVLQSTGMTSIFGTDHRNAACWSAGRLRPADMALIRRLHTQATTAVVPTMMGNVFEADHVLAAACFALVSQARDAAGMRATAEGVIAFHSRDLSGQPGAGGPGQLAPSPELREAARQARAWLDGVEVEPGRRPTRSLQLPYRPHAER